MEKKKALCKLMRRVVEEGEKEKEKEKEEKKKKKRIFGTWKSERERGKERQRKGGITRV